MYEHMIQEYINHMTPEKLQALAHRKGVSLTHEEARTLVHLVRTEYVDFSDQESVYAFINQVEKATSKDHAMLLHDLYQKYGGYLR
ncbi:DUF2624 family protein [Natribacillus halophilus]|uniref:Uncharacterized protein n=1 Tax=Natribacillus halophilus TaxID=549003 RepID=A0A1G8JQS9_9BACI|nr:DUF2624 family protein [Natribacillus halophilus]SDI33546.1 Protein of unknown function [Natribacillus halophilus]